jgi:RNA polymerase sigma-70 factor (ECF subfamily)
VKRGNTLDRSILEGFVQGDPAAFETLYRHFEPEVRTWVLRIVRDGAAADEVLVEAFWRAYRGRARFDPSRSFGAWMRSVANHAALDHLKRVRREARATAVDVLPRTDPAGGRRPGPGPRSRSGDRVPGNPSRADDGALRDAIAVAFRRLPPKLQVTATLALVEGLSHAEIADALDVPVGTVKSRVFHAVRALRKELERLGIRA